MPTAIIRGKELAVLPVPQDAGALVRQARMLWLLAGLVTLAIYALPLGCRIPLLDPDEGLHAAMAQEMVEQEDYVAPRLLGQPFFDKPILYFWLQAVSLWLFGMNEAAVRLPGLACGIAGALTTALLARRLFGGLAAPLAAVIYLSMAVPLVLAQAAVHDVALVPFTNLALLCLWSADDGASRGRAWLYYLACGGCLGLAILTKGLIGVALVLLAFGGYLLAARRLCWQTMIGVALAGVVAVLAAAPWYLAMHVQHPGYLHYYFVERHLQGFTTANQRHGGRPWWYYLPVLVGGGLPWSIYLPTIAVRWWRRQLSFDGPCGARPWLFLGVWLASGTLFLSVAGSKLWTYYLPLFPALALLATGVWVAYLNANPVEDPRWYRNLTAGGCVLGSCLLPIGLAVAASKFSLEISPLVWIAAGLVGITSLATAIQWRQRRYWLSLFTLQGSLTLHVLYVMVLVMPLVAGNLSGIALAERFNQLGYVPEKVLVVNERVGSLIFYLRRDLRARLAPDQIGAVYWMQMETDPTLTRGAATAVPEWVADELPADSPLRAAPFERVGHYRLYDTVEVADRSEAAAR